MSHRIPPHISSFGTGRIEFPTPEQLEEIMQIALQLARKVRPEDGENFIKLSLIQWPEIFDIEIEKYRKLL